MTTIAFIGLGNMGIGMVGNLAKAGHDVRAFDLSNDAVQQAVALGCVGADNIGHAVAEAEIVVTMLPAGAHVKSVYCDAEGVFAHGKPGALMIDSSTIDVTDARDVIAVAKSKGFEMIDAPVSGGQAGAENGALTVMVGGEQAIFDRAAPVIEAYSQACTLIGPAGSGQLAKMVNQICIAGVVQGLSEAVNFGMKAGLDMEKVIGTISKGAAQSWQMENRWETMVEGKFDYGFAVDWMRKDLGICLAEAERSNARLPTTALIDQFYAQVQARGGARWDTSSLVHLLAND